MTKEDKIILTAIKEDAENGFRMLMARFKEPVYWHIRRLLIQHSDSQDAAQETFIRIFRSLNQFKGKSSLTTWIYRIATNEALRILDRRDDERCSLDDAEMSNLMATDYVDYSDLEAIKLQKAIQSLPAKQQITFNLRYYDELGYEEIAEITESTPTSAKANYHTAKEKIVQYMNSND